MARALLLLIFLAARGYCGLIVECPFHWPQQYSVDIAQTVTTRNLTKSPIPQLVHYNVDGYKLRTELLAGPPDQHPVSIFRVDQRMAYHLRPTLKGYYALPLSPGSIRTFDPFATTGAWEKSGSDFIGGINCDKYHVSYIASNNQVVSSFVWLDKKNNTPVRWLRPDKEKVMMIDFSNFKPGPIDPRLFEPPTDYKKLDPAAKAPAKPTPQPQPNARVGETVTVPPMSPINNPPTAGKK